MFRIIFQLIASCVLCHIDLLKILNLCETLSPTRDTSSNKSQNNGKVVNTPVEKCRKVTFQDKPETMQIPSIAPGGSAGRQLVPGLLLMQQEKSGTLNVTFEL